ncbi:MAG TPA: HPr(Ser) kinase/phosphatase [Pyrinomonadaceae bacterium]|nr:HPr(Ser) kinase/phosphatase [Pyrinomonadaceae bacterium]
MQLNLQNEKPQMTVEEFVTKSPAELSLKVLAGDLGLSKRKIVSERIQKLGLALAGFPHYIHSGRIQIVGQSETQYLSQLTNENKTEVLANLDQSKICCILITKDLQPSNELRNFAETNQIPILQTPLVSSAAINAVTNYLLESLAPTANIHGVLLGMYGIGVLILGDSGIGKSECALDLVTRGHRLISDDSVIIKKVGDRLMGESPDLTYEHLEIRGLGILNIRELFGISAVGKRKRIILCIKLRKWEEFKEIDRLGCDFQGEDFFGVKIPEVVLPVSPGRNISTLVETAVKVHLLREEGYDAAQLLIEKHSAMVSGK